MLDKTPFKFFHKPRGWIIDLNYQGGSTYGYYTLEVNGVKFDEMDKAIPRERAALARTSITTKMDGFKR